jgi:hypothetical protein
VRPARLIGADLLALTLRADARRRAFMHLLRRRIYPGRSAIRRTMFVG